MKKIFSVILAVSLLLTGTIIVSATDNHEPEFDKEKFLTLAEEQKRAVAAHDILYNSFLETGDLEAVFPQNYGGDFIDGSILHICIVDLPNQDISPYLTLLNDYSDCVVFDNVAYPLQMLIDGADATAELLLDEEVPVVSYKVDEINNAIVIGVEESDFSRSLVETQSMDNLYSTRQREFELPVYFEISEPCQLTSGVTLMGGLPLNRDKNDNYTDYTLGICGYYTGNGMKNVHAFALCGHGLKVGNTLVIHETNTLIGNVAVQNYVDGGSGDYAIATMFDADKMTNIVGNPDISSEQYRIISTTRRPAAGTAIIKYGARAGFAYGSVKTTYYNFYDDFYKCAVKNLVEMAVSSGNIVEGDSGGPVFTSNGTFCGTVTGMNKPKNSTKMFIIFSPYQYLNLNGFSANIWE